MELLLRQISVSVQLGFVKRQKVLLRLSPRSRLVIGDEPTSVGKLPNGIGFTHKETAVIKERDLPPGWIDVPKGLEVQPQKRTPQSVSEPRWERTVALKVGVYYSFGVAVNLTDDAGHGRREGMILSEREIFRKPKASFAETVKQHLPQLPRTYPHLYHPLSPHNDDRAQVQPVPTQSDFKARLYSVPTKTVGSVKTAPR